MFLSFGFVFYGINFHYCKSFCNSIFRECYGEKNKTKQNLSIILIKPDYFGVKEFPDAVVLLLFCFVMLAHTHTKLSYLLQLLSETGEYKEAMEVLKKALKLEPATKVRLCGWATSATTVN